MSITTQKDDDITKVFMNNTYVGYIEGDEMFAFDKDNRAHAVKGINKFDVVEAYLTLRELENYENCRAV